MVRLLPRRVVRRAPPRPRVIRSWKWLALIFSVLALTLALIIFLTVGRNTQTDTKKQTPVMTVQTKTAVLGSVPVTFAVTGTVAAIDLLTITPEANGLRIVSVPVEEGQWVNKGQVLAELDSSLLRAQLQGAQARLAAGRAQASIATQPNRPQEIATLQEALRQAQADVAQRRALVLQAEANATNAESIARRYEMLLREQAVSEQDAQQRQTEARAARQQVEAARANLQAAQFAVRQAQERLNLARIGGRSEEIAAAQAQVRETQANIRQLQTQINQTIIRAPDSGLITKRDARIGDTSSPTKSMFQMVRKGELELRAQLPQRDLVSVQPGQSVMVTDGVRTTNGTIWSILPTVDPATRLATVRVKLPVGSAFMPGMFARGAIQAGSRVAVTVPNSAVLAEGADAYVFIYEKGIARRRPVQVGVRTNDQAEIVSGLKVGEPVIIAGAAFLNDGDAVRLGQ